MAEANYDLPGDSSANRPAYGPAITSKTMQDDADTVAFVTDKIRSSKNTVMAWRKEADTCDKFYAGWQWEPDDLLLLREQNRPVITFNRTKPIIDVVTGTEKQNRQEARFVPRHPELDQQNILSDLTTETVKWVINGCNGDDERSVAFHHTAVRGMGWTEIRMDYTEDPDGKVLEEAFDGMEAFWDTAARKQNLEDATWLARRKWLYRDDIYKKYPHKKLELVACQLSAVDTTDMPDVVETVTPIGYDPLNASNLPSSPAKSLLPVIHMQWFELEDFYRTVDDENPEGPLLEFSKEQFETLRKRLLKLGQKVPKYVKQQRRAYKYAIVAGSVLLEDGKLDIQTSFTFKCMTAFWDPKEKYWFGLVRSMLDPQRAANKWLSQALQIVNTNAKGGLILEEDAVSDPRQFEDEWSDPSKISFVRPGALKDGKIQEKTRPDFPQAMAEMVKYAIQSLRDTTGINIEMLGFSESGDPAVASRQKQSQAMTILAGLFNSLTRFRKEEAKTILEFVRNFIADGRLIRIGGDYNAQAIPLLRDPLMVDYDVIVDENPRNPNVKMEVWATLSQLAPALIKFGMFAPELLDYSPLPAHLVAKLKEKYVAGQQQQQQMMQYNKQFKDPKLTQADIELKRANAALAIERAKALDKEVNYKQIETLLAAQTDTQRHQFDSAKFAAELMQKHGEQAIQQRSAHLDHASKVADIMKKVLEPSLGGTVHQPPIV